MRKGISLLILVITIIVIIILSGAVIMSLNNNNPISKAMEASYKSSIDAYKSSVSLYLSEKYSSDRFFDSKTVNAGIWDGNVANIPGTIKEILPNIKDEDAKDFVIVQGVLQYVGNDINKISWTNDTGIMQSYVRGGLILAYDGNDITNSPLTTTIVDRSSNLKNGTLVNFSGNTTSGSDGNGAIAFDGVNDNIAVTNMTPYFQNKSFTFSTWVYFNNTSASDMALVSIGPGGTDTCLHITRRNNRMYFGLYADDLNGVQILDMNTWYYVTCTFDATTRAQKIYVNGIVDASRTSTGLLNVPANNTLYIGAYFSSIINGKLDNITLYDRVLTDAEINQNYNIGR